MPNIQSDGTFGQGVAYIYDRLVMNRVASPTAAPTPSHEDSQQLMLKKVTDLHTFFGISFLSSSTIIGIFLVLGLAYGLYYCTGGRATPRELLCGFSSASKPFKKQIRLASMDDSGYSERSTSSRAYSSHNLSSYSTLDNSSSHGGRSSRFSGGTRRFGGPPSSVASPPPSRFAPQVRSPGVTPPSRTAASMTASSNPYLAHRTTS